jgi:hypothetical protein
MAAQAQAKSLRFLAQEALEKTDIAWKSTQANRLTPVGVGQAR